MKNIQSFKDVEKFYKEILGKSWRKILANDLNMKTVRSFTNWSIKNEVPHYIPYCMKLLETNIKLHEEKQYLKREKESLEMALESLAKAKSK